MERVVYKLHPTYQDYLIGDDGSVWSAKNGQLRKITPVRHRQGYYQISAHADGAQRFPLIHRLVLEAFVGPCPSGHECRHLDGSRTNNALSNICWGSKSDNAADKVQHGTATRGERSSSARLTTADVIEIRRLRAAGWRLRELADKYGITDKGISRICLRKTWAHVTEPAL